MEKKKGSFIPKVIVYLEKKGSWFRRFFNSRMKKDSFIQEWNMKLVNPKL